VRDGYPHGRRPEPRGVRTRLARGIAPGQHSG
jgi:hypothetical protein